MRALTEYELDLVAGGTSSSDYWDEFMGLPGYNPPGGGSGGGGDGVWVATWTLNPNLPPSYFTEGGGLHVFGGGSWGWTYIPNGTGGGANGGDSGAPADSSFSLPDDFSCPKGAALAIAGAINSTVSNGQSTNANNAEYATYIVPNGSGGYGAVNDTIYSQGIGNGAEFPDPTNGARPVGFIHNHPDSLGNSDTDNHSRYPSTPDFVGLGSDYDQLESMVEKFGNGDPTYDPVAWIIDSKGVLREFKWSDRETWANLNRAERIAGVDLPPAVVSACGG